MLINTLAVVAAVTVLVTNASAQNTREEVLCQNRPPISSSSRISRTSGDEQA
jgi:hypothetical protein